MTAASETERDALSRDVDAFFRGRADLVQNPYPLYHRVRAQSPVFQFGPEITLVLGHAEAKSGLRQSKLFRVTVEQVARHADRYSLLNESDLGFYHEILAFEALYMQRNDGAIHKRLRSTVQGLLTPPEVEWLREFIQRTTDEYCDSVRGTVADLTEFANLLPLVVIMHMLGAPTEDAPLLKKWGEAVHAYGARTPLDPDAVRYSHARLQEYRDYAAELVERSRLNQEGSSVIRGLLDAERGGHIDRTEIVAMFMLLLFAGHETTSKMIGSGIYALMTHRAEWVRLCESPETARSAVEEIVRFDAPAQLLPREAVENVRLGHVDIPAGAFVLFALGAANRDPAAFVVPDELDLRRRPNDHLGFGTALHFCLGAPLARLEGEIVFSTFARRFPDLELACDSAEVTYAPHIVMRGLESLPISFQERQR